MITWDVERFICQSVENLLPRFSDERLGLLLKISIESFSPKFNGNGERINLRREIEFLFLRPSNYTRVFARVLKGIDEVEKDWIQTCHHDFCWRSDGLKPLFENYMKVRNGVQSLNPDLAWIECEVSIAPSVFNSFSFVDVELAKTEDSYTKRVIAISEPKKFKITFE